MILGGLGIRRALDAGDILIDPFRPQHLNPNSYDVTLGRHLANTVADVGRSALDMKTEPLLARFVIPEEGYVLKPGFLYLGVTQERVGSRVYRPRIDGRSSIGRLGMSIHVTAGYGDVGWGYDAHGQDNGTGHWTLEIHVLQPLRVYAGVRVGQIEFERVEDAGDCTGRLYQGKYAAKEVRSSEGEPMPVGSRLCRDFTT